MDIKLNAHVMKLEAKVIPKRYYHDYNFFTSKWPCKMPVVESEYVLRTHANHDETKNHQNATKILLRKLAVQLEEGRKHNSKYYTVVLIYHIIKWIILES
ncbi:hypothetical protein FACS1894113_2420 [Alphaproteobacteria bacterium]|nr:hypothetical protein FACS1894113_2420 [Alphaproteobacteria bacterium]